MMGLEPTTFCMAKGWRRSRPFVRVRSKRLVLQRLRVGERTPAKPSERRVQPLQPLRSLPRSTRSAWVAASRTTPLGRASDERELRTHQSRACVPNCSRRLLHQATAPRSLATFELKSLDNPRRHARRRSARLPKCATRSPPRLLQLRRRRRKSGPTLCSPRHLRYVGHSNGFDVLRLEVDRELRSPLAERQRRDSRNGGFSTAED
jgi:hypothetical protein